MYDRYQQELDYLLKQIEIAVNVIPSDRACLSDTQYAAMIDTFVTLGNEANSYYVIIVTK